MSEAINYPENYENWPRLWKSCFEDGYNLAKSESEQQINELTTELLLANQNSRIHQSVVSKLGLQISGLEQQINEALSYAVHTNDCKYHMVSFTGNRLPCSCGLSELLEKYMEAKR